MSSSVESLIHALQRFMNRRGVPQLGISDINVTMGMMAITDSPKPEHLEDIVDRQRTSKYLRTLRSVGWILRWRKSTKNIQTLLTSVEFRGAKSTILKEVQKKFFWEELKALESGQPVHQQSSFCLLYTSPSPRDA